VSLVAVVLWVSLAAEPSLTPAPEPTKVNPAALQFEEPPPPPKVSDDARVKRFLGALAGGVVGLGATLAIMPAADGACFPGTGITCVNGWHGLLAVLAPFMATTGAWAGFSLMGGDGGWLTPVVAIMPALLVGLGLLSVAREVNAGSVLQLMPFLIASGLVLAGGSALALHLRAQQLERLGAAASWGAAKPGRVALVSLVAGLAAATSALLTGLVIGSSFGSPLGLGFGALVAVGGTLGTAAAAWGVHQGLGGRGSFGASLAGLGVGWLVVGGGIALFALSQGSFNFSPLRSTAGPLLFAELAIVAGMFTPVLALELSHTAAIEAGLPKIMLSAAPIRDGGMVGAAMRF
jgi:hypothetical protein